MQLKALGAKMEEKFALTVVASGVCRWVVHFLNRRFELAKVQPK